MSELDRRSPDQEATIGELESQGWEVMGDNKIPDTPAGPQVVGVLMRNGERFRDVHRDGTFTDLAPPSR